MLPWPSVVSKKTWHLQGCLSSSSPLICTDTGLCAGWDPGATEGNMRSLWSRFFLLRFMVISISSIKSGRQIKPGGSPGSQRNCRWRQMFCLFLGLKLASVFKISWCWNSVWNRSGYSLKQRSSAVVNVLLLRFKDNVLYMAACIVRRLNSWTTDLFFKK